MQLSNNFERLNNNFIYFFIIFYYIQNLTKIIFYLVQSNFNLNPFNIIIHINLNIQ